jgi:hypothetical protein
MTQAREFHFVCQGKVPQSISMAVKEAVERAVGKRLCLSLSEDKNRSTTPQRRYYFGVIVEAYLEAFLDAGNDMTKDDMHLWLKQEVGKLFKEVVCPETGEITRSLRSYRDLDTQETENYHTQCRMRAAQMDIDIPEPWEGM